MQSFADLILGLAEALGVDIASLVDLAVATPLTLVALALLVYIFSTVKARDDARRVRLEKSLVSGARRRVLGPSQDELRAKLAPKTELGGLKGGFVKMAEAILKLLRFNRAETEKKLVQAGERDAAAVSRYILRRGLGMVAAPAIAWFALLQGLDAPFAGKLVLVVVLALAGGIVIDVRLDRAVAARRAQLAQELPVLLDLLTIYLEAGVGFDVALQRAAQSMRASFPAASAEIGYLRQDLEVSVNRERSLREFAERIGVVTARTFVSIVIQSEGRGSPIAPALRVVARETRKEAMREVERKAQKIPTVMQGPMFIFILPAIFLSVLAPAAVKVLRILGDGL